MMLIKMVAKRLVRKVKAAWQEWVMHRLKKRYTAVTKIHVPNIKRIWQDMESGAFFVGPEDAYLRDFKLRAFEKETILGVAHNHRGLVFVAFKPYRHYHLLHVIAQHGIRNTSVRDQGFFTSHGRFVGRTEALRIACAAKQLLREVNHVHLFSEDVWDIPEALNVNKPKT